MDEKPDFKNFDAVWARVTESKEPEVPAISPETKTEEKLCILPRCEKSRAVRFIPET